MWFSKRQTKNLPVAFSVQPSRQLLGNDGNWSTFALRAGSDGQNFQVLVSTSSQEIWLPVPQGCATTNSTGPVPSNCPQLRGVGLTGAVQSQGFVIDNSTTRDDIGIYDLTLGPSLDINALGSMYSVDGDWDLDTASLPSAINQGISITADKVPLVGLTCWEFFVASLGLGYGILSNGYGNFSSFSESLVKASEIPSRSWAYTAGAYYRQGDFGSLVLGGFDQSRYDAKSNPTSASIQTTDTYLLEVQVSSIVVQFNESSWSPTANSSPFTAVIDSTLPYLYLPSSICNQMATRLGLDLITTSTDYQLYTINQTQRANNYRQVQNIRISVTNPGALENPNGQLNWTTITFPYAAFDLNATWPISPDNLTSYFPILPAPTDTFILGRTFLQEAYVIADFERDNFSVYQTTFPGPNADEILVPIYNISVEAQLNAESKHLPRRDIAGIVVGCVVFVVIVVGILWVWLVKKRRPNGTSHGKSVYGPLSETTATSFELESNVSRTRPRHTKHISELSSDAEHERGRLVNVPGSPTINEMEDKSDATQWQLNAQRMSELPPRPQTPQEVE